MKQNIDNQRDMIKKIYHFGFKFEAVRKIVMNVCNVNLFAFKTKKRNRVYSDARHLFRVSLINLLNVNPNRTAKLTDCTNASVLNSVKKVNEIPELSEKYKEIETYFYKYITGGAFIV